MGQSDDDSGVSPGRRITPWRRRVARLVLAVVAVATGLVVLSRPTTGLDLAAVIIGLGLIVTGVAESVTHDDESPARGAWRLVHMAVAVMWIVAGAVLLVLPSLTVRLLVVVVGVGLVVNGVVSVATGVRRNRTADARIASVAFGVAGIVFGVLALTWPDITLLVVSVLLGARLIVAGIRLGWDAARGPSGPDGPPTSPGLVRRWGRTAVAVVALGLATGAAVLSGALLHGSPVVDDFYAAPRDVPAAPGRLIRSESFTRGVPADARAWRILYTTTRGDGDAATASALVVVPRDGTGPRPVIDWAHGTTGVARQCAPSLAKEPFESGALFLLPQIVAQGWALVATDYIGLGTPGPHPYLIGPDSAHATLDAVRAARELADAGLGATTVVWGHSQGGGAALWTGALAHEYASDVPLAGVAALAPASDLPALFANLPRVTGGSVFAAFVMEAYAAVYDDVSWDDYVRPGAVAVMRTMAGRCLAEPGVLASVLSALALERDPTVFVRSPLEGALGRRATENIPPPMTEPLLVAQGGSDTIVTPASQDGYVRGLCAAGHTVDYRRYPGLDHLALVRSGSPLVGDLVEWTRRRLAGERTSGRCTVIP